MPSRRRSPETRSRQAPRRRLSLLLAVSIAATALASAPPALPNQPDSLKLAVIGDNGTGDRPQYEVGRQMASARARFGFELVLMLGDNIYGRQAPADLVEKFERPYALLLEAGVRFQATLGNHDSLDQRFYRPFGMGGERYYTYAVKNVRFFVLDTNSLDRAQVAWFERELQSTREDWKIAYFHHPLYGNARRHGAQIDIRVLLEPLLVRYGVSVALSGHDHVYERLHPQKGVHYFVIGNSGKLRRGDMRPSATTAAFLDQDQAFMLAEIAGDEMFFETISRTGVTVDAGAIRRRVPTLTDDAAGMEGMEGAVRR